MTAFDKNKEFVQIIQGNVVWIGQHYEDGYYTKYKKLLTSNEWYKTPGHDLRNKWSSDNLSLFTTPDKIKYFSRKRFLIKFFSLLVKDNG